MLAALDLRAGPLVLHVPDTGDRYYVLQFVDAWTNNFAYIGRRATGTGERRFLLRPTNLERVNAAAPRYRLARVLPERRGDVDAEVHLVRDCGFRCEGCVGLLIAGRNRLPNRRRALVYNFWGGKLVRPARFRTRPAVDLTEVLSLLADGSVTPHVAARFPLHDASRAMALAESRTVYGKVVLVP